MTGERPAAASELVMKYVAATDADVTASSSMKRARRRRGIQGKVPVLGETSFHASRHLVEARQCLIFFDDEPFCSDSGRIRTRTRTGLGSGSGGSWPGRGSAPAG